jgi:methylenetetrahydrofolate dehydrogenase (NADP+)/methenyltetrahydrofolate cyclohydrolase
MTAVILSSKQIVEKFKEEIKAELKELRAEGSDPTLAAVICGWDGPSKAYALSKEKACQNLGMNFSLNVFNENITEGELMEAIWTLNNDPGVHGILLELPLPRHISAFKAASAIKAEKDVDGIGPVNRGLLLMGNLEEALIPVTPLSCLKLIEHTGVDLSGLAATIIGRGETVGLPLSVLLIKKHATVTVCHSKTKKLKDIVRKSDIVVAATGRPSLITKDMLSEGQIVIDAGISVLADGKISGDVEKDAADIVAYLSPVPGGVGSLTVSLILKNVFKALKLQKRKLSEERSLKKDL